MKTRLKIIRFFMVSPKLNKRKPRLSFVDVHHFEVEDEMLIGSNSRRASLKRLD